MSIPSQAQKEARAENNVIRAFASLHCAIKQAGMDYANANSHIREAQFAFTQLIEQRREFRKHKKEGKV